MKRISTTLLSLLFVASVSGSSHAATSLQSTVTANIVETLAIISRTPLDFGFITPSMTNGTVTVSADNQRTTTGNVELNDSSFARAVFVVRGTPNRAYSIHTPSSVTFTVENADLSSGSVKNLTVSNFKTRSKNSNATNDTGKLGSSGEDQIYLGGTLTVPANAVPGQYRGLVPLTVSY